MGTLTDIIGTYSPTGHEEKAVEKFNGYLKLLGASEVHKDRVGNSIGTLRGSGLSVALCGHIDTVPGRLPVKVTDGMLHGRGAVDAKSSLISLLFGARLAKDRGFGGTLYIMAAIGEEGPGKGITEIADSHQKTDYAIFGEPSGTTGITAGYRGRLLLDVLFHSRSYHASAPWMGANAVDMAINSWQRIKQRYGGNREFSKVSAALTSIHAGHADNVTPSSASMTLDIRYPPSKKGDELLEEFRSMIATDRSDGNVEFKLRSQVDPYVSNVKNPLVDAFRQAVSRETGEQPSLLFKSGSGDMNILGTRWSVPSVTYGPGDPQLSHTDNEVISLAEVQRSAEIVSRALLRLEEIHISES